MNETPPFIAEQVRGWLSTLMRDLDAQGVAVSIEDVSVALRQVIDTMTPMLTEEEFNEFLRELNGGRDD